MGRRRRAATAKPTRPPLHSSDSPAHDPAHDSVFITSPSPAMGSVAASPDLASLGSFGTGKSRVGVNVPGFPGLGFSGIHSGAEEKKSTPTSTTTPSLFTSPAATSIKSTSSDLGPLAGFCVTPPNHGEPPLGFGAANPTGSTATAPSPPPRTLSPPPPEPNPNPNPHPAEELGTRGTLESADATPPSPLRGLHIWPHPTTPSPPPRGSGENQYDYSGSVSGESGEEDGASTYTPLSSPTPVSPNADADLPVSPPTAAQAGPGWGVGGARAAGRPMPSRRARASSSGSSPPPANQSTRFGRRRSKATGGVEHAALNSTFLKHINTLTARPSGVTDLSTCAFEYLEHAAKFAQQPSSGGDGGSDDEGWLPRSRTGSLRGRRRETPLFVLSNSVSSADGGEMQVASAGACAGAGSSAGADVDKPASAGGTAKASGKSRSSSLTKSQSAVGLAAEAKAAAAAAAAGGGGAAGGAAEDAAGRTADANAAAGEGAAGSAAEGAAGSAADATGASVGAFFGTDAGVGFGMEAGSGADAQNALFGQQGGQHAAGRRIARQRRSPRKR